MRAIVVTSLAVASATAIAVPLALSSWQSAPGGRSAARPPGQAAPERAAGDGGVPGSTRTIPLAPLASGRDFDRGRIAPRGPHVVHGLNQRAVQPFSLLGVTWTDPAAALDGSVQVRTRSLHSGRWSHWQDIEAHTDHAPETVERDGRAVRGGTAPLWVGPSNGVEVRVLPRATGGRAAAQPSAVSGLPEGLRLDMVDPGQVPGEAPGTAGKAPPAGKAVPAGTGAPAPGGQPAAAPAPTAVRDNAGATARAGTDAAGTDAAGPGAVGAGAAAGQAEGVAPARPGGPPYVGPRPEIVSRAGWRADESLREREFLYTGKLKLAFVHHSATGNNYSCSQAPAMIRSIYRYHVLSNGWRDIGYNFLIDKCGTIYEGRAGGVTKAVMGAHTYGFNSNSMGIAVLGTFSGAQPPAAAVRGVARLTAWKLGLFGVNPNTTVKVTSGGGKYPQGTSVRLRTISGHRDGYSTDCPGQRLYDKLGSARSQAAALQGREASR